MRFLRSRSVTWWMDFFRRGRASAQWPDSARDMPRWGFCGDCAEGAGDLAGACALAAEKKKKEAAAPQQIRKKRFMARLYIQVLFERVAQKRNGRRRSACHPIGGLGGKLEYELQSKLKLTSALGAGDLSQLSAARIKGATGRSTAEGPDGMVESVEGIQAKLESSLFADADFLLQAGVEDLGPRAADVADGAGAERTASGGWRADHATGNRVGYASRIRVGR